MENNEKLKALLSKDYMPIIYKNIKKYRKESKRRKRQLHGENS